MTRAVPYPADTRAKGWRFELDHEKIEQSDTWALAPAELRPWLLMLWMTAWRQEPCGSLPADDELVAAKIGMPLKAFIKARAKLMRGWWLADDGRLYHDTLTLRVTEMMTRRRSEADRKARGRAKQAEGLRDSPGNVPRDIHGTGAGLHPESDTGTGTGTGTGTYAQVDTTTQDPGAGSCVGESAKPTKAGTICRAIKAKGLIAGLNPSNPELLALVEKGVPVETFEAAAEICVNAKPPKGFAYLLGIVKRQLGEAAAIAAGVGMPEKPWDHDRPSIEAKGLELGLGKWDEAKYQVGQGERFDQYTARVRRAVEALAGVPA